MTTTERPASSSAYATYDAVVFAGGGCRCFWQLGFWESAAPALGLAPRVAAGVSAGAAMVCAALAGTVRDVVEDFKQRCAANARNVYPRNLGSDRAVFPHERMYRGTILETMSDEDFEGLRRGPDIRILLARPAASLGSRSGLALAVVSYVLERRSRRVHARWGRRFGFRTETVSIRSCETRHELADLILHSSCSPPFVPLYRRGSRIVVDGGVVDNAPADLCDWAVSCLVLLSRRYGPANLPSIPGRTYVEPSREIPVSIWDYTNPALIQATYDLGRADGEAFAKRAVRL